MLDEKLIETINAIQEARAAVGMPMFDLPRIAVVGGQSAGKSSVLESIVGFDFLPRGTGIVTRRPLVIRLVSTEAGEKVRATIRKDVKAKKEETTYTDDLTDVRKAIKEATDDHPECINNGVCSDPIFLEIRSPDVLTLTLVDLPGMVAWTSNKANGIRSHIEKMVKEYIEPQNTVILAVVPANSDVATAEAVRVATQYDPKGSRTIGVLTKVDIMDEGTEQDAKEIIQNNLNHPFHVPFKWIPVKNRSQKDINDNKNVSAQRTEEKEFFERWLQKIDWNEKKCGVGIDYLTKILQAVLVKRIRKQLPRIESEAKTACLTMSSQLEAMKKNSDMMLWKMQVGNCIQQYCKQFSDQLNGRDQEGELGLLCGGAKIVDIYKGDFVEKMNEMDPLQGLDDKTLLTIAKNCRGHGDSIFLPHDVLQRVVNHNVERLVPLGLSCVDAVCDELNDQAQRIKMDSYTKGVVEWIHETAEENINAWKEECSSFVTNLIKMERRINHDHPHYYSRTQIDSMLSDFERERNMSKRELQQMESEKELKTDALYLRIGTDFDSNYSDGKYSLAGGCLINTINSGMSHFQRIDLESNQERLKFYDKNVSRDNKWDCLFQCQDMSGKNIFGWCSLGSRDGYRRAIVDHLSSRKIAKDNPSQLKDVYVVKKVLSKYFNEVIRIKVLDSVPKAIAFLLVDAIGVKLWKQLNDEFLRLEADGHLRDLMEWSDEDERRKEATQEVLAQLTDALQGIDDLKRLGRVKM